MSEKSPAVLQTNRNIWNFFQLYGDTEIGSSPCCPSLRDLHLQLLSGAASDNTRCHTISEHRANIPAFCFMITSTLFTSASEILFVMVFFMWKAFWKLDVTYIHYEMKIPHVFRMEKTIPSFQENFVNLLKTRVLAMHVILPNEKFPSCFSGS